MKKKSIWIIDDDAIYKFVIQKLIAKSDLFDEVKTFSNGEEASNALKNEVNENTLLPDIILLDIEMPRMDGWEFMSEIEAFLKKENQKNIKIFMSSSSIAFEDKEKVDSNPNINGYLTKPISYDDLLQIAI
ncbi:response regulator [Flavobacterium sp. NRK F7]|uniref:response regulator n=1 Tax=Flavobacterium sp. NRK F7 TaxID=2954930 RepID=UPI0020908027|nr:response regulator [Flavobacterium sp. NRK F7]MCO6163057.1 response regulator [Flavobacterium sp. NRK F7]